MLLCDSDAFNNCNLEMYGQEDENGRQVCQNLPSHEDAISSVKFKRNSKPMAKGYWTMYGSGHTEYTFTYGFSGQFDTSQSVEYQKSLNAEMSAGIMFLNESLSESYKLSTAASVQ